MKKASYFDIGKHISIGDPLDPPIKYPQYVIYDENFSEFMLKDKKK